jgi:hypothetical protein
MRVPVFFCIIILHFINKFTVPSIQNILLWAKTFLPALFPCSMLIHVQFYQCEFLGCFGYAGQCIFLNRNMLQPIVARTRIIKNYSLRSFESFHLFTDFPIEHTKYHFFVISNSIYSIDRKKNRITDRCSCLVVMLTVSQCYHCTNMKWKTKSCKCFLLFIFDVRLRSAHTTFRYIEISVMLFPS